MPSVVDLRLVGHLPCLDFVNSVDWRTSDSPVDFLPSFDDLLQWSAHAAVLAPSELRALGRRGNAAARCAALRRAIAFREASYRIVEAAMRRHAPEPADVRLVEAVIAKARASLNLHYEKGKFRWSYADGETHLDSPLWKIALSLDDLLTSHDLALVKECGGPGCGWLFFDVTKNHARRWCSMEGCGNRAKARRFYDRYIR